VAGQFHLAQVNIARLRAPIDSERLADFVANLDRVNALADASSGFVWRLQTEDGDATAIRAFDDDSIIVNMSVWTSVSALGEFVYRSDHVGIMRRRTEWFHRSTDPFLALWWIRAHETPTIDDAKQRLDALRDRGPTAFAFTFRTTFPSPDADAPTGDDHWSCPAL
jgi:Domain of unknown function (DUF3291)